MKKNKIRNIVLIIFTVGFFITMTINHMNNTGQVVGVEAPSITWLIIIGVFTVAFIFGIKTNKQRDVYVNDNKELIESKLGDSIFYKNTTVRSSRDHHDILDSRDPTLWQNTTRRKDPIMGVTRQNTIYFTNNNNPLAIERLTTEHKPKHNGKNKSSTIIFEGVYIIGENMVDKHINMHIRTDGMLDHNIHDNKKKRRKLNLHIQDTDNKTIEINGITLNSSTILDNIGESAICLLGKNAVEPETLSEIATLLNGLTKNYNVTCITAHYLPDHTPECSIYVCGGTISLAIKGMSYFDFPSVRKAPKDGKDIAAKADIEADMDILIKCIDVMNQIIELLTY